MVFPKRIYYGFKDFQPSSLPKGSRSSRGKRAVPSGVDRGNEMFAFNLLATVAGNLLGEKETQDPSKQTVKELKSIVKCELQNDNNDNELPKFEPCDQGSCDEGKPNCKTLCKPFLSQGLVMKDCSEASSSVVVPAVTKLEATEKSSYESTIDTGKVDKQASLSNEHGEQGGDGSGDGNGFDEMVTNLLCAEDPQDLDSKPPTLVSSDSSVELPTYQKQNYTPFDHSVPNRRIGVKFVNRYDDENSSQCYPSDTINSNGFKPQCIGGDRRIKKSSEAIFRKVKPSRHNVAETKCMFRSGKMYYTGQKIQKSSFKRRKLFERFPVSASRGGEMRSEVLSMSPGKSFKGETNSSATARTLELKPEEHNVKCSIKSFVVPEVVIDMPDSATVGELKRRTEDALTSLLHYGLQVGIALQGKKVSDDSKTLLQSGISHAAKFGSLSFSLELNSDYPHCPQASDASEPLSWFPTSVPSDICMTGAQADPTYQPATTTNKPETDLDLFPLGKTEMQDTSKEDTNTLAVVPVMNSGPLSVIPLRKSKRSELVQRRIRRPFSVSEVEALVHAVEKLGTGRWRDVKIRAFDNAKHRTYVDLKDKWKTLVHTARISPQQRRGEPVPQELLDRVLSAHAYWSQQQARSQIKHDQPEQKLLA